jgi:hypothetical protein
LVGNPVSRRAGVSDRYCAELVPQGHPQVARRRRMEARVIGMIVLAISLSGCANDCAIVAMKLGCRW